MATLEENYICQHFDNIYREICNGTTGQATWRMRPGKFGKNYLSWKVKASKKSVLESIKQFLYLCLNSSKVGSEYAKIERWTRQLMIISCTPLDSDITDADKYSVLVQASDPFTKFFFGCFDWMITDMIPGDKYGNSYLDLFDLRIRYYQDCASNSDKPGPDNYKFTADLLFDIKIPRNDESHGAKEVFYTERTKCMQRLVYSLYDYITAFYMISNVCADHGGYSITLLDDIKHKTKMPNSFLTTHIVIECVDESTGENVLGRQKDIRLYCLGKNGERTAVSAVADRPDKFKVTYFEKYIISIVSGGEESDPSETFVIEHDFIEGTVVRINIPPNGRPKPQKVSIRELIFNSQDLPADIKWILSSIESYADNNEYAEVARQLIMASVTKSQFSKKAYQNAVKKLEDSLKQKLKDQQPNNLIEFMQAEMQKFHERISKPFIPYRGKEDFFDLLECIDNLYDMFGNSGYDKGTPHIAQILNNAEKLLDGTQFSVATTASDESTFQTRRLAKLKFFLSMEDKYPEIVEAESANLWKLIEQLYLKQTNYYYDHTTPVRKAIGALLDEIKNEASHQPALKKAQIYAFLVDMFLNDTPDNIIRIVQLCSDTLLYWIDRCETEGSDKIKDLGELCRKKIKNIRDNRELLMPMITVNDDEKHILEQAFNTVVSCINKLKNPHDMMEVPRDSSWMLAELRYDILVKLARSCSPESLMQLVCCSLNVKRQLEWFLNYGAGIKYEGFPDGLDYHKWQDENTELLKTGICEINALWKHFSGHDRHRKGDIYHSEEIEINNAEASLILKFQAQQLNKIYGGSIPDFLNDIINASSHVLPIHVKIMLLREVCVPLSCLTESLVHVTSAILSHWGHSSHLSRHILDKYETGDYSKRLVTQEALDDFFLMPQSSQQQYLQILMTNENHFACLMPCVRYMMAFRLNFAKGGNGNGVIDQRVFFKMMTFMHPGDIRIRIFDYKEFVDLSNVVSLVTQYSNQHPDDSELSVLSADLTKNFIVACLDYLDKYLNVCPIKDGRWNVSGILHKMYLRQELKSKNPDEQIIVRYLDLYNGLSYNLDDPRRYNSGWCEVEKELFYKIIAMMKEMNPEYQQGICNKLWSNISLYKFRMPYDDIKAERLMALRPFFNHEEFEEKVKSFYSHCIYGHDKLTIGNSSVLEGLNVIRTLFMQYGEKVDVPFNGQSTAFVDILIAIYKMKQEINTVQE